MPKGKSGRAGHDTGGWWIRRGGEVASEVMLMARELSRDATQRGTSQRCGSACSSLETRAPGRNDQAGALCVEGVRLLEVEYNSPQRRWFGDGSEQVSAESRLCRSGPSIRRLAQLRDRASHLFQFTPFKRTPNTYCASKALCDEYDNHPCPEILFFLDST